MVFLPDGDFQCAYQPFACVNVSLVVKGFQSCQHWYELLCTFGFEFGPQLRRLRNVRNRVSASCGLQIESWSAAENRNSASVNDVLICFFECLLVLVKVEFGSGIDDVNEVIRDFFVFAQVFSGSDVHAAIYLAGISGKDFRTCIDRTLTGIDPSQSVQFSCECDCIACLSRSCRPEHAD